MEHSGEEKIATTKVEATFEDPFIASLNGSRRFFLT